MNDPTKKKRRVMHSLTLTELSAVDNPAQVGAKAVLLKRADDEPSPAVAPTPNPAPAPGRPSDPQSDMTTEAIIKNAVAHDMGTEPVKFTYQDYNDAMCDIARLEKRATESAEQALVRLLSERDARLEALARAAMFAPRASKQAEAPVAKSASETAYEELVKAARTGARQGETVEQAMTRLLTEGDSHVMAAYQKCRGQ